MAGPGGVPCFDSHEREGGGREPPVLHFGSQAGKKRRRQVLHGHGSSREAVLGLRVPAEVEERSLTGCRSEHLLEDRDVCALVRAERPCPEGLPRGHLGDRAETFSLGIEGGLQIFEIESELEDPHVARRCRFHPRRDRERRDENASADDRLPKEIRARVPVQLGDPLLDRTVSVELFEG